MRIIKKGVMVSVNRTVIIGLMLSTTLCCLSCVEEICTIDSWEGTYVGIMNCDGVDDPDAVVSAFLGFEGLIVVNFEGYIILELFPEECGLMNVQRATFINDYTESSFTLELKNEQIKWEQTITKDEITSICQGVFSKQ